MVESVRVTFRYDFGCNLANSEHFLKLYEEFRLQCCFLFSLLLARLMEGVLHQERE